MNSENRVIRMNRRALLTALTLSAASGAFAGKQTPNKWALLIGIDQYQDTSRVNQLGAAAADARAMSAALVSRLGFPAENVELLVSPATEKDTVPSKRNIFEALTRLTGRAQPGDIVFVLFAGHGMEIAGKSYLLPYDVSALSDADVVDTALETAKFQERLRQIQASLLLLCFDMCRSNPLKQSRDPLASNPLTKSTTRTLDFTGSGASGGVSRAANVVILHSCSEGERAYEYRLKSRGYFSYFLEEGLTGKAADATGNVSVTSLTEYLTRNIPPAVARDQPGVRQTPYFVLAGASAGKAVLVEAAQLKKASVAVAPGAIQPVPVSGTNPGLAAIRQKRIECLRAADGLLKSCKEDRERLDCLLFVSRAQARDGDVRTARQNFAKAQTLIVELRLQNDSRLLARTAVTQATMGDFPAARVTLRKIGDSIDRGYAAVQVLRILSERVDAAKAGQMAPDIERMVRAMDGRDQKPYALMQVAQVYSRANALETARTALIDSLNMVLKIVYPGASCWVTLGIAWQVKERLQDDEELDSLLEKVERKLNDNGEFRLYFHVETLGIQERIKGNGEATRAHLEKMSQITQSDVKEHHKKLNALARIVNAYCRLGDFGTASELTEVMLDTAKETPDHYNLPYRCDAWSFCARVCMDPSEAELALCAVEAGYLNLRWL